MRSIQKTNHYIKFQAMKGTEKFKEVINEYLVQRSTTDLDLKNAMDLPSKSLDNCIQYILNVVQKSGCNGFEDSEVFAMAVEYYLVDNAEIGKPINSQVVINRIPERTQEEKLSAKQKAVDNLVNQETKRIARKPVSKAQSIQTSTLSLFD